MPIMSPRRLRNRVCDGIRALMSPSRPAPRRADLVDHNDSCDMEYATYEAREASFAPPTKRAKGWPHKSPSPQDLARAGFFWKPTTSKDNVECFVCGRYLDGWEEDDDPLVEHFKHGPDCAWALLMTAEAEAHHDVDNMEDPTGKTLTEARRSTFEILGWPHESKRGWTCKTEKLVEAGWHFAPTKDCEDYTTCVYCKLSLDGWEPKDNPFDEHYRRSPDCPFFAFAGTTQPSKRTKKQGTRTSRSSKVSSRLSTQSDSVMNSQVDESTGIIEILGHDTTIEESVQDNSIMSIQSTKSTATAKGKRKAPARAKAAAPKKPKTTRGKKKAEEIEPAPETEEVEPGSQVQPVLDDSVVEIAPPTKPKSTRGRKKQPAASADEDTQETSTTTIEKAPPKKTRGKKKNPEPGPEPSPEPEDVRQPELDPESEMEVEAAVPEYPPEPHSPVAPESIEDATMHEADDVDHRAETRISQKGQRRASSPPSVLSESDHPDIRSEPPAIDNATAEESDLEMQDSADQATYPSLPVETPEDEFADAAEMPGAFDSAAADDHPESGPPEKEGTPVPFKQISPLKEQSNPPRPTLSPAISYHTTRRSSQRVSLQQSQLRQSQASRRTQSQHSEVERSSSPPFSQSSDQENQPPTPVPRAVRTPTASPSKMPTWDPIDVDMVLQTSESHKVDLFPDGINGDLSDKEKEMTVQEWFVHLAAQAEANLSAEGERIVSLFEREGQRALALLQSIECS